MQRCKLLFLWIIATATRSCVMTAVVCCAYGVLLFSMPMSVEITQSDTGASRTSGREDAVIGWSGFGVYDYQQLNLAISMGNSFAMSRVLSQVIPDVSMRPLQPPQRKQYAVSSYPYSLASNVPGPVGAVVAGGKVFGGGDSFLLMLGGAVPESGALSVEVMRVSSSSGSHLTVVVSGNKLLSVALDAAATKDVSSAITLPEGSGSRMSLAPKTVSEVFDKALNQEGIAKAVSMKESEGVIELVAAGAFANPQGGAAGVPLEKAIQRSIVAPSSLGVAKRVNLETAESALARAVADGGEGEMPMVRKSITPVSIFPSAAMPSASTILIPPPEIQAEEVLVALATDTDGDVGSVKEIKIINQEDNTVQVLYLTALNEMTTIESADNLAMAGLSDIDRSLTESVMRLLSSVGVHVDIAGDGTGNTGVGRVIPRGSSTNRKAQEAVLDFFQREDTAISIPDLRLQYHLCPQETYQFDDMASWCILAYHQAPNNSRPQTPSPAAGSPKPLNSRFSSHLF